MHVVEPEPVKIIPKSNNYEMSMFETKRSTLKEARSNFVSSDYIDKEEAQRISEAISSNSKPEIDFDIIENDYVESYIPLTIYAILISMGGLIFGYDIGTIGGLVDLPSFTNLFGDDPITNAFKPITKGAIVSISCLGGLSSGIISTKLIPFGGLKVTMFSAFMGYITGSIIIIFATTWKTVLIGRLCNGLAIGLTTITCPMFISELATVKQRGVLTCFNQLFITIGIVLGATTIYLCSIQYLPEQKSQFQCPLTIGIILAFMGSIGIWFVPESPIWLVHAKQPLEKVKASICKTRNLPPNHDIVINLAAKLFDNNYQETTHTKAARDTNSIIKGKPKYLLRVFIGIFLFAFQQFTGINYFFYYGVTIFEKIEIKSPFLVPILFGCVNLVFSVLSIFLVSIFRRKLLLLCGGIGLSTVMTIFTIVGSFNRELNYAVSVTLVFLSCLFISIFSLTWGPVVAVLISEMYPHNIKVKAMSICGSCSWIFSFTIALVIPMLSAKIGFKLGFIFAGVTFMGIFFVRKCIPETKGISSDAIERKYENSGNGTLF